MKIIYLYIILTLVLSNSIFTLEKGSIYKTSLPANLTYLLNLFSNKMSFFIPNFC